MTAECGRHEIQGDRWIHWIDVHRHQRGYEPFASEGRYWIRRGGATVHPSPSEFQELLNAFGLVLTEQQIIPSATVDDIDFSAVRTFLQAQGMDLDDAPQPTRPEDLLVASVADEVEGTARPTLYGLMVFGRQPQAHPHTHNLFVQCTRYDGRDRSADVLSAAEGTGRLEDQVRQCMGWYRSLGRREEYRGLERIDIPMVPEPALREAIVNAVVHRDYAITGSQVLLEVFSDRIVVTSPGALPNHMTVERATGGGAPRSRNEMMAQRHGRAQAHGAARPGLARHPPHDAAVQRNRAVVGERFRQPLRPRYVSVRPSCRARRSSCRRAALKSRSCWNA